MMASPSPVYPDTQPQSKHSAVAGLLDSVLELMKPLKGRLPYTAGTLASPVYAFTLYYEGGDATKCADFTSHSELILTHTL